MATATRQQEAIINSNPRADQLLTEQQAAEYLAVRPQTLAVWRCTRRYPIPFIRVGTSIRYRRSALEKWLERRTVTPAAG